MSSISEVLKINDLPESIKFQLNFIEAVKDYTPFKLTKHLGHLDQYINSEIQENTYASFSIEELCDEFPHLRPNKEVLSIIKSGIPFFKGLYQLEFYDSAFRSSDLFDFCKENSIAILKLNDSPLVVLSSLRDYLELNRAIAARDNSNEVVFWLNSTGLLSDDSISYNDVIFDDLISEEIDDFQNDSDNLFHVVIANKEEVDLANQRVYLPIDKNTDLVLQEETLPFQARGLLELISSCERKSIHRFNFRIKENSIQELKSTNNEVTLFENSDLVTAIKTVTHESGLSFRKIFNQPTQYSVVIEMNESSFDGEPYECSLMFKTVPTLDGVTATVDLMYSSELFIKEAKSLNLSDKEGKVVLAFDGENSDPQMVFTTAVRSALNQNDSAMILAIEEQLPIYFREKHPVDIKSLTPEALAMYSSMGVKFLLIGEITTTKLANAAILAAQCGITVLGWVVAQSDTAAKAKFTYLQGLLDTKDREHLADFIAPVSNSDLIDQLEGM